ncbi:MAG: transposase [Bacteroidia bacterium]
MEQYNQQLNDIGERNSMSKTDKDATFMRMKDDHMRNGQLKPGYYVQISSENQFITQATLHQTPGDTTTLKSHLNEFEENYSTQSKEVVADAGYGSEQNYELLKGKSITPYVKYNYFHKNQKRSAKDNPFLVQNPYYNAEENYFVCPMGQRMDNTGTFEKESAAGYISTITTYQAQKCNGCSLRSMCHNSKAEKNNTRKSQVKRAKRRS